jgi:hypothetical protein
MATADEEIARLTAEDGYEVTARTEGLVELVRKHSWLSVFMTGLMAGGHPGLPRGQRLYLWIDHRGQAEMGLYRPPDGYTP